MRVIGGEWRGRRIVAPEGRDTRPTSDRVREAIFSAVYSLAGELEGMRVLDLYAGSGAMGIEALSRGAAHVTFVESHRRAADAIVGNLEALGASPDRWRVLRIDATRISRESVVGPVSLLFADPPYRIDAAAEWQVLETVAGTGMLRAGALVVYEHSADEVSRPGPRFDDRGSKRYGDTAVSFAVYEG